MEKLDPNLEARVWQRIGGQTEAVREDLRPLLLTAWEQAAVFRHLAGLLTGKQRERMKILHRRAMEAVACLKGLQRMRGNAAGELRPQPIPKEPARRLLEKAFHRALRLMTEYTARAMDPEFGTVFQQLADRERENSLVLAEILGGMEG